MKIAVFHELHEGGARRAANEFAGVLKINHQVDLYVIHKKIDEEKKFYSNIFFYKFGPRKWTGHDWKTRLYKDTIELYKLYKLHKKIAQEINARKYDIFFCHPSQFTQTPFILRFIKTKKVYYCQEPLRAGYEQVLAVKGNSFKILYEKLMRYFRKKIDKRNARHADRIIAGSNYIKKVIKKMYGRDSIVGYMGVDTQVFQPINVNKKFDLLYIGSLEPLDGYPLLEQTLKSIRNKITVKTIVHQSDWITDDNELCKLYCQSKIVLALMHNESFGLIPIEAMACGVPVIAVNEGGYKETVEDGVTGYLLHRDPKLFAQKIEYLLSSPEKKE